MSVRVAKNLLKSVCVIEGMMAEINAKLILVRPKIKKTEFRVTPSLRTKMTIKKLEGELKNLNNLLDVIENSYIRHKAV